jgi:hypothetical protein
MRSSRAFAVIDRKKAARNLANAEVFLIEDLTLADVHPLHWLLHVRAAGKTFGDSKRSNQSIARHLPDLNAAGYYRVSVGDAGFDDAWAALLQACRSLGTLPSRRTAGPDWTGRSFFVRRAETIDVATLAIGPDNLENLPVFIEGAERQVTRNVRERDPVARRLAEAYWRQKNNGRLACLACNLDFGKTYGPRAEGFMHFHHLRPLGDGRGERATNPAQDLVPLCANCHAVVHLGSHMISPEEVAAMLAGSRSD